MWLYELFHPHTFPLAHTHRQLIQSRPIVNYLVKQLKMSRVYKSPTGNRFVKNDLNSLEETIV